MRYMRRRNLEHHSEAINLLAALQAPMHFFLFFLDAYFFATILPRQKLSTDAGLKIDDQDRALPEKIFLETSF